MQVFVVICEVFFTEEYYALINIVHYFDFKFDSLVYSVSDVVDMNTRRLFNLSEFNSLEVIRPVGITIHSISGGYILGVASLVSVCKKQYVLSAFLCFFMLFFGSKGPILMFMACLSFYLFRLGFWLQFVSYLFVVIGIVMYGLNSFDPHAYSLMATLKNIPFNPFGQGMGFGGVLTTGTNFSLEEEISGDSGLAVLLNMMGLFGLIYYYFLLRLKTLLDRSGESGFPRMIGFMILASVFNSVVQEEGFSPYFLGIVMVFSGISYWKISMGEMENAKN